MAIVSTAEGHNNTWKCGALDCSKKVTLLLLKLLTISSFPSVSYASNVSVNESFRHVCISWFSEETVQRLVQ